MGGSEAAVRGVALVRRLLRVASDGHGGAAVVAHLDLVPGQRSGDEGAGAIAVEPLLLVQNESTGADQGEVGGGQRLEGCDVTLDTLDFGLVSCRELVPDLWDMLDAIMNDLAALGKATGVDVPL